MSFNSLWIVEGFAACAEFYAVLRDALFYWYRISYIAVLKTRFRPGVHGRGRRFVAVVIPICAWAD